LRLALLSLLLLELACREGSDRGAAGSTVGALGSAPAETTSVEAVAPPAGRVVAYYGPAAGEFVEFRRGLIANRFLDTVAARLNETLVFPADLTLATGHCGEPNASYEPEARRVTLCYELFRALSDQFAEVDGGEQLIAGTLVFALAHEMAHGVIDLLQLPVTGREEDAADQLATVLLLAQGDAGDSLAFGAVSWFAVNAQAREPDALTFADDHGLDLQRYYNILCWIYGRHPARYPDLVSDELLPAHRAARCPEEYRRIADSWDRLLAPHRRRS
jgi:hypothetical protein